ncbi:MAG: phosphoadenosine phosphosulfate reductase family protein [Anaerovoracaceae bacterium]
MKYIASVSFGKDSLAMLLRLIEDKEPLDEVVFYDTGMEFEAIYNIRDKIRPILKANNINYTELYPQNTFTYDAFERLVKNKNRDGYHYGYSWCGGRCRWGTTQKLSVIKNHCKGAYQYVGIAADEVNRFDKEKRTTRLLPLVEWNMTEVDCLRYCRERDWNWYEKTGNGTVDLYEILDRVSCWCCANKNRKELKNIYQFLPEYWDKLKRFQDRTDRPMKKYSENGIPYGDIYEMEATFKKELGIK